jgi:hypothetical protein
MVENDLFRTCIAKKSAFQKVDFLALFKDHASGSGSAVFGNRAKLCEHGFLLSMESNNWLKLTASFLRPKKMDR